VSLICFTAKMEVMGSVIFDEGNDHGYGSGMISIPWDFFLPAQLITIDRLEHVGHTTGLSASGATI
jgi:hypothetical protein